MSFTTEIQTVNNSTQSRHRVRVTKLLLMGPSCAGKTAFGKKLEALNDTKKLSTFNSDLISKSGYRPTPGIDFYRVVIPEDRGQKVYVLWELGGQVRYQPLWSLWWKGAKGAFVILDSTAMTESYLASVRDVINTIRDSLALPYVICLNKRDLSKCDTTVMEYLSKYLGVVKENIVATCAITGLNMRNALYYLLDLI